MSFSDTSEIAVVARERQADRAQSVSFREYFRFAPSFTLEKLKEVKLSSVCHYPTGIQFVKFFLGSSPVLETMELRLASSHVDNVSAEVLRFDKASPNAKITFTSIPLPPLF